MALHTQYRKDKTTAWVSPTAGVEMEVSHYDVRSPEYQATMAKVTKPVRKLVEQNLLKPADDRKYAIITFVKSCVKNWRTIDDNGRVTHDGEIEVKAGEYVRYSEEKAVEIFNTYPQLYNDVVDLARDIATFQVSEDEEKN